MKYLTRLRVCCQCALLLGSVALKAYPSIEIKKSSDSKIEFTLKNKSDFKIKVLKYTLPLHGVENNIFHITNHRDHIVEYIGKLKFRLEPTECDWVQIEPHQEIKTQIDLSQYYSIKENSNYKVNYNYYVFFTKEDGPCQKCQNIEKMKVSSNKLHFCYHKKSREIENTHLSNDQETTLFYPNPTPCQQALAIGQTLAHQATQRIQCQKMDDLYKEWFGNTTLEQCDQIMANYSTLENTMATGWTFCHAPAEPGVIAYVYPHKPHTVWLSPLFYSGEFTDTQRGSFLLHEATHWKQSLNTEDTTYDMETCKILAHEDPEAASKNAENYRYFALEAE